jgi:hypothetical protein
MIEQFLEQTGEKVSVVVTIQISVPKKTIKISADAMFIVTADSSTFRQIFYTNVRKRRRIFLSQSLPVGRK